MPSDAKPIELLISFFSEQPCWMIAPLAAELRYSIPSVRRFLVETGYVSSFTHNGSWYTLRSIPRFGRDGLWFYRDIGFSHVGSLTNTLIEMVTRSPAGMTAERLGDKLRCRCHSILVHLCRNGKLQRQKQGRSHIYLAADPHLAAIQQQGMPSALTVQIPAEIAVLILVEFIRNPNSSFDQLVGTIARNKGVAVDTAQVARLFAQHELKKTIRTAAPTPYEPLP
jgi:hypothetical protein